ncbi:MAG: hypothetical protein EXR11_02155 [Rhodospirillaceae bacterium]|nr:hypothetical protein [Rhodospirillaceae bacterium]
MLNLKLAAAVFGLSVAMAIPAAAQFANAHERTPDAGNPAGPLNPPGVIPPFSGNGVQPLSGNYLGGTPQVSPPTGRNFLSPPGFLPTPRDGINRAFSGNEQAAPASVVLTLPPAATGRQGLPPQTWALLTAHQQDLHRQAETAALGSQLGEGFTWDDAGRSGEVRVIAERFQNNRPCREFSHFVYIDGQRVEGTTTMCR